MLAILFAFVACDVPTEPQAAIAEEEQAPVAEPVAEAPAEPVAEMPPEPAPEPEPEPEPIPEPEPPPPEPAGFVPEPGTIYILAADDSIYLSEMPTADLWDLRVRAYGLSVETYNRRMTKPGPYPYRTVFGERP